MTGQVVTALPSTASDVRDAIEVLPSKAESRNSITIRVLDTNAHFRIAQVRDPQQPRLWCVAVRQCSAGGVLDASGFGWVDRPGTSRTELAATIDSIRDDISGWLCADGRNELRQWLLTVAPVPTPAEAIGLPSHSVKP